VFHGYQSQNSNSPDQKSFVVELIDAIDNAFDNFVKDVALGNVVSKDVLDLRQSNNNSGSSGKTTHDCMTQKDGHKSESVILQGMCTAGNE